VSRPLVAGASGSLLCPSWPAHAVRSPRAPGQSHLSSRTPLVARPVAAYRHGHESETVSSLSCNPHGMGVLPPFLKSVREIARPPGLAASAGRRPSGLSGAVGSELSPARPPVGAAGSPRGGRPAPPPPAR